MYYSEIMQRVRDIAGDVNSFQFNDTTLVNWMNDAEKEIVLQNSLCQRTATMNTVVGQDQIPLPLDILKFHSITYDSIKLPIRTLQEHEELMGGDGAKLTAQRSTPQYCWVWASNIHLFPTPDSVKELRINFIFNPNGVSVGDDYELEVPTIPSNYHLRMVTYCLAQVALQDEDYTKYDALMTQFQAGVLDLKHMSSTEEDVYPSISVSARDMGTGYYPDWDY